MAPKLCIHYFPALERVREEMKVGVYRPSKWRSRLLLMLHTEAS